MNKTACFCGSCKFFHPYKSHRKFVKGYWMGDGKCTHPDSEFKVTVVGNTCEYSEKGEVK